MRSSDLIFGIAYDIPAFTMFQELIANELNVGLGTYTHTSNSLHIYERHFDMAEKIIRGGYTDDSLLLQQRLGPMPALIGNKDATFLKVKNVYDYEAQLQSCNNLTDVVNLYENYDLEVTDTMFNDFATVLTASRLRKLGFKDESKEMMKTTCFNGYSFNVRRDLSV